MYLNTILGWCMARRWAFSPVGIRTRDFSWTVQELRSDWASGLGYLPASAGVGTAGDTIGTMAGESNTTTTPTFHIAGPSSIAIVSIRREGASTIPPIPVAAALAGAPPTLECIPAPSAGSIMAGSPDPIPSEDSPVLGASTEGASAVEGSMAGAEASMVE